MTSSKLAHSNKQYNGGHHGARANGKHDRKEGRALNRHAKKQRQYLQKNSGSFEIDERQDPSRFPAHLFNKDANKTPQIYTKDNEHRKQQRRSHADPLQKVSNDTVNDSTSDDDDDIETDNMNIDALLRATRDILPRRINFREATRKDEYQSALKNMKPLNGDSSTATLFELVMNENDSMSDDQVSDSSDDTEMSKKQKQQQQKQKQKQTEEEEIENNSPLIKPNTSLYPRHKLLTMNKWSSISSVGPGLDNLGNTCFMNAALQCLLYTPCFFNYLSTRKPTQTQKGAPFHALNEMTNLVHTISTTKSTAISPRNIAYNLKSISRLFRLGRQEDSHEFIINLIDKMEDCILKTYKGKLEKRVQETNAVHQIFGGYLRSQVKSLQSDYISNTYDPFVDLSLQLNQCSTVEKALSLFVTPDVLDGDNKYKCPLTKKYVKAMKGMTIHEAPPVLVLQLKRFNMFGKKIGKHVGYGEVLDLSPYMSEKNKNEPAKYNLHGVLVHSGGSCTSGHYYSYVKASNGTWYEMNDSSRRQVSLTTALKQQAYILFYSREFTEKQLNRELRDFSDSQESEPDTPVKTPVFERPKPKLANGHTNGSVTPQTANGSTKVPITQPKIAENGSTTPAKPAATTPGKSATNGSATTHTLDIPSPTSPCLLTKRKLEKLQNLVFKNNGIRAIPSPVASLGLRSPVPQSPSIQRSSAIKSPLKSTSQEQALNEMDLAIQKGETAEAVTPVISRKGLKRRRSSKASETNDQTETTTTTQASKSNSTPIDPQAFSKQLSSSQYSEGVEKWDSSAPDQPEFVPVSAQNTKKRKRDDWDKVLDAGRRKRVREVKVDDPNTWERNNKSFQKTHEKLQRRRGEGERKAASYAEKKSSDPMQQYLHKYNNR